MTAPNGCAHCGVEARGHAQRWRPSVGWHVRTAPSDSQRKERMLARRDAQAAGVDKHDDGACTRCGVVADDIWPVRGQRGYFCRACVLASTGHDPETPDPKENP